MELIEQIFEDITESTSSKSMDDLLSYLERIGVQDDKVSIPEEIIFQAQLDGFRYGLAAAITIYTEALKR